ncbi:MAG: low molecular weight protein-tyrosine-phosphatase [Campylobacteraceae bacterium]
MSKKLLFVCLGNICRSPLAEGIARAKIAQKGLDFEVDSAGTSSWHEGNVPCFNSILVAKQNGIDISKQKSRPFKKDDIKNFDMILALDENNLRDLQRLGANKAILLGDFGLNGEDIPDPYYYKNMEGFHKVYKMIDIAVENLLLHVKDNI